MLQHPLKRKRNTEDTVPLTLGDVVGIVLRTLKLLVNFMAVLLLLGALFGAGIGFGYIGSLFDRVQVPQQEELLSKVTDVSQISRVVYADGSLVSEINSDLLRTPIASDVISDHIKNAVIATEDATFRSHNGVVPKAVLRAALGSVGAGASSGGSTLTQQLIKQQLVGDAPTFTRKANEIVSALALERAMKKDDILTTYLNVSPFGRNNKGMNIAGVEEAAQGIFGKSAKDVTVPQAAFIAGLPQSPIVYSPYLSDGSFKAAEDMVYGIERYKEVLYNLYRNAYISKEDYEAYAAYDIRQDFKAPESVTADTKGYLYYAVMEEAKERMYDYLIARDQVSEQELKNDETIAAYQDLADQELRSGGYTITSTVRRDIYEAMQRTVAEYGGMMDDGTGHVEVGNVLMDNRTGAILGFVGGRDYASNQNNHAFTTKRSPGSTIKPLMAYGIAIDQGLIGSASVMSNYPTNFSNGAPVMYVQSRGTAKETLQQSLDMSYNIPAFWSYKLLQSQGVDVKGYMDKMNYTIEEYDIESVPLGGGVEISVLTNTNAYQTIANGGEYLENYIVDSITNSKGEVIYKHELKPVRVYSKATASILAMMLRRVVSSGLTTLFPSTMASINPQLAGADWIGKTGTSNDSVDVWLMVATPYVTLGSWAGHDDNTSLHGRTGYSNNSQFAAYLADAVYQVDPSLFEGRFELDSEVIASTVLVATGQKPGTVTVNGQSITVGGPTTTSYWAKNGAPVTGYKFMVGGTESDHKQAWDSTFGAVSPTGSSSSSGSGQSGQSGQSGSGTSTSYSVGQIVVIDGQTYVVTEE